MPVCGVLVGLALCSHFSWFLLALSTPGPSWSGDNGPCDEKQMSLWGYKQSVGALVHSKMCVQMHALFSEQQPKLPCESAYVRDCTYCSRQCMFVCCPHSSLQLQECMRRVSRLQPRYTMSTLPLCEQKQHRRKIHSPSARGLFQPKRNAC